MLLFIKNLFIFKFVNLILNFFGFVSIFLIVFIVVIFGFIKYICVDKVLFLL